ncbi:hypothetical protein BMS3Abin14_01241 [bacterium BMS3Abin14]|nr:hypothetical protein BMS3Abin14_01241 [bacterium BMS3Abin14]
MTPIRISSGLREQETVSRIHRSRQRKNLLKYDQPHEVIILYPTASRSPPCATEQVYPGFTRICEKSYHTSP